MQTETILSGESQPDFALAKWEDDGGSCLGKFCSADEEYPVEPFLSSNERIRLSVTVTEPCTIHHVPGRLTEVCEA
jgi:hypothetical protein